MDGEGDRLGHEIRVLLLPLALHPHDRQRGLLLTKTSGHLREEPPDESGYARGEETVDTMSYVLQFAKQRRCRRKASTHEQQ